MRQKRNWARWALGGALAATLVLSGCSGGSTPGPSGTGGDSGASSASGVLHIGTTTDVANWVPLQTNSISDMWVLNQLYPSIVTVGPDGEFIPHVADEWTVNDAGDQLTLTLNPDFGWSDGEPITADDVIFTLDQMREYKLSTAFSFIGNVAGAVADDANTVTVTLAAPSIGGVDNFLRNMRLLPQHVYEGEADLLQVDVSSDEKYWVSGGSFALSKIAPGQRYEFVRNEHYPLSAEGNEAVTGIEFNVYRDMNTMQLALQNGDLDLAAPVVPATAITALTQQPSISTIETENAGNYSRLVFNTAVPPLDDPEVRRAISGLIDTQAIIDTVLQGRGTALRGPLFELLATDLPDLPITPTTPEDVKKVLADAGYADLSLDLSCDQGNANHLKSAQLIHDDLAAAGITVNLTCAERATAMAAANEGKFDMYIAKISPALSAATTLQAIFGTDNIVRVNYGAAGDAQSDTLIADAMAATDDASYIAALTAASAYIHDQAWVVPLYTETLTNAYNNSRFEGYVASPYEQWRLVNSYSLSQVVPAK
ncbi:ABC transporter substrate-binding protein [Microbacterium sp. No. 7]|uniref:ABC transporter substrate-binding protein n=1 Tax=Microbacterium sp. No. 7 TaxID=1714373 RepID=UPI0006CF5D6C|nr:ABC transporter substrate-binding protein [Microbacterium sp. No. 7]ALJ19309.1 hypothetical protein AOA12_05070 [Microbacterium sp. No. 7]